MSKLGTQADVKQADAAGAGAWDVAFLAVEPQRASEEVDRRGVRISVTEKSAYDLYLSRTLKHAQLVHAPNTPLRWASPALRW